MAIGLVLYSPSPASRNVTETLNKAFLYLCHILPCVIVDPCVMKNSLASNFSNMELPPQ